jgi:hypothetical protein
MIFIPKKNIDAIKNVTIKELVIVKVYGIKPILLENKIYIKIKSIKKNIYLFFIRILLLTITLTKSKSFFIK